MARHASIGESCWYHTLLLNPSTLYLKWMPRREWRETNRIGRKACRSVFKLEHHWLTKNAQNLEAFDACRKTNHGTFIGARAHTKKHSALEERFSSLPSVLFDFRTLAASWSTRYASAQRAELHAMHDSCTACVRVETSKARVPRYEPQKRAYLDTKELLRGRTTVNAVSFESKTEKWTTTRAYEFVHELHHVPRGWN